MMIEKFRARLERIADRATRLHRPVLAAGSAPVVRALRNRLDGTPSACADDAVAAAGARDSPATPAGDGTATAVGAALAAAVGDLAAPGRVGVMGEAAGIPGADLGEQMEAARRALRGAARSGTVLSGGAGREGTRP